MTSWAIQAQRKIGETVAGMLAGSVSYLEGALRIARFGWEAGIEHDPDILPFVDVSSETLDLPIDPTFRRLWSPSALEMLQPKIDAAEEWARRILEPRCQRLLERFGPTAKS